MQFNSRKNYRESDKTSTGVDNGKVGVENEKVGVDNEKALELDNRIFFFIFHPDLT